MKNEYEYEIKETINKLNKIRYCYKKINHVITFDFLINDTLLNDQERKAFFNKYLDNSIKYLRKNKNLFEQEFLILIDNVNESNYSETFNYLYNYLTSKWINILSELLLIFDKYKINEKLKKMYLMKIY